MGLNEICAVCLSPTPKVCSACHIVSYCSPEHQKLDWKNHKKNCVLYKIEQNEVLGRYVVAIRNIPKGTIIFTEDPLVVGPKMYSLPICLGCHRRVDGSYFCSKCGFPMCSAQCEKLAGHKEFECKIFQKKGKAPKKIKDYDSPNPIYQSILPLRCLLLRDRSPAQWELLNTLEHHLQSRKATSEVWNEHQVNIVQFLREWFNLKEEFSEDDINRVIGFIEVNSFQIKTINNIEVCGLFKLGAMMSHDCVANTHHAFTEDGRMILRSSIDIKKGGIITACYVESLSGTMERRQMLETTKYFSCTCTRCRDPTEFRTYLSALKCSGCEEGYLLPENPLNPKSIWICYDTKNTHQQNTECKTQLSVEEVNSKIVEVKTPLQTLLSSEEELSVKTLEDVISTYAGKAVHSNHYLLIPIWQRLHKLYQDEPGPKDLQILERNNGIILKLFSVLDVLDIGYSRARGVLLHEKYKLDTERNRIRFEKQEISSEEYEQTVQSLARVRKELEKIFQLDLMIGVKQ